MHKFFSKNGQVLPIDQATVSLASLEYAYGFGVYETIRARQDKLLFLSDHSTRLLESAAAIQLDHTFTGPDIDRWVRELVVRNQAAASNVKILLIGGPAPADATLYILCLPPLFPDRKLYTQGAEAITVAAERAFPQAKTLNMLPSYLAYRQAKNAGSYDALLVNRHGHITEGTRTNFFTMTSDTIYSPPAADILLGVTRHHVLQLARDHGYTVVEQPITLEQLGEFDIAFLTSTSAKILPLQKVGEHVFPAIPAGLKKLMALFNDYVHVNEK